MGRIKTTLTKRIGTKLCEQYDDQFTDKFDENKLKVSALTDVRSKKLRNIIAGYVTRLTRNKKSQEL